ncbi:MAG: hypothetical protein FJ100_07085 [Deltaproteobacteria bacterium]|nr:hypothetical protein [Deltaproteobacteria bacterium]
MHDAPKTRRIAVEAHVAVAALLAACGTDVLTSPAQATDASTAAADADTAEVANLDTASDGRAAAADLQGAEDAAAPQDADTGVAPDLSPPQDASQADIDAGPPCQSNADCPQASEPCTESRCEAKLGFCKFVQALDGAPCDDDEPCTLGDKCKAGQCIAGKPGCNCKADADCAGFDDGDLCNGGWVCNKAQTPSVCAVAASGKVVCPPGDSPCTANVCNPVSGGCEATPTNDGGACEDGKVCTSGDHCAGGTCVPGKDECPCKKSSDCDDDGDACNGVPYCDKSELPWTCKTNPGTVVTCNKGSDTLCVANQCNPKTGTCVLTPVNEGGTCEDGNPCSGGDSCKTGTCAAGVNLCGCNGDAECKPYDDADLCNGTLFCNLTTKPHQCQVNPKTVVVCPSVDDTACTKNQCDKTTGKCGFVLAKDSSPCNDDNPCTTDDNCQAGVCTAKTNVCPCNANGDCANKDDGNLCNGTLYCDKSKVPYGCAVNPATVKTCPSVDNTACLANLCLPKTGNCAMTAVNEAAACEADGNPCTVGDVCSSGACKAGPNNCPCAQDSDCDAQEDGNLCNGTLYCHKATSNCVLNPNSVVQCSTVADTTCAANQCDPKNGKCAMAPRNQGLACDADGNACTQGDVCDKGVCVVGVNTCGCQATSDCNKYEDGNPCNGTLYCDKAALPYQCKVNPATVKVCGAGVPKACQVWQCNPKTNACEYFAGVNGTPCEDGVACTVGDVCAAGSCTAGSNLCGCYKDADCGPQEDGNLCNGSLYCDKSKVPYLCKVNPYSVVQCPTAADSECLFLSCEPKTGLCLPTTATETGLCNDGDACTLGDNCKKGECVGSQVQCDDGIVCTFDACDPGSGCVAVANAAAACNDDNVCTVDTCDAKAGCAHAPAPGSGPCDDGDPCTGPDTCGAGKCAGVKGGGCDDGNLCTDDACAPAGGACLHTANTLPCEGDLRCAAGVCGACRAFGRPLRVGCDLVEPWPYYPSNAYPPHPPLASHCEQANNKNLEEGEDATELSDGRLLAVGAASLDGSAATVGWAQWFLPGGKWLADQTYGKAGVARFLGVASAPAGGAWAVGVRGDDAKVPRPWLVRLDAQGKVAAELVLAAGASDAGAVAQFEAVTPTSDGGCIAVGWTQGAKSTASDAMAVRFDGAAQVVWTTVLTTTTANQAPQSEKWHAIAASADGQTFALAGQRGNVLKPGAGTEGWLVLVDANGQWLWQRDHGGPGHDILFAVSRSPTGGWVAAGTRDKATINHPGDGWVLQTDSQGLWVDEKVLPGPGDDVLRAIGWHPLRGWLAAGSQALNPGPNDKTWSANYDRGRAWFVRLKGDLSQVWQTHSDHYGLETIRGGSVLREGDLWVAGDTRTHLPNGDAPVDKPDGLALRVDGATGQDSCACNVFERTDATATGPSRLESVTADATGQVFAVGWQTASNGLADAWVQALDPLGKVLVNQQFGKAGEDRLYHVAAHGKGFVAVGSTDSTGLGGKDGWLVRLDANGKVLGEYTFGGSADDELLRVQALPDGAWLAVGRSKSLAKGGWDGWAVGVKADFTLAWEKRIGDKFDDGLRGIALLGAGANWRILVAGHVGFNANPNANPNANGYLAVWKPDGSPALDASGKGLETQLASNGSKVGTGHQLLFDVARLGDGSAVAVGHSGNILQGGLWWVRIDAEGHAVKEVVKHTAMVGGTGRQVLREGSNGFVVVGDGSFHTYLEGGNDGFALRIDGADVVQGFEALYATPAGKFGRAMAFSSFARLPEGHYLAVGHADKLKGGTRYGWVLRMDAYLQGPGMRFNGKGVDGNCTFGRCGQAFPARARAHGDGCTDDNECTVGDQCTAGLCQHHAVNTCDDGNPCTLDSCYAGPGCTAEPTGEGKSCAAGLVCGAGNCGGKCQGLLSASAPLPKHEQFGRAVPAAGGGWWVTGLSRPSSMAAGQPLDAWFGKIDVSGKLTILFESGLSTYDDALDALVPMPDGSLWLAGWVQPSSGDRDVWLVQVGADGKVKSDAKFPAPKAQAVHVGYPSKAGWLFAGSKDGLAWFGERDVAGKVLWESTFACKAASANDLPKCALSDLAPGPGGLYWLQAHAGDDFGGYGEQLTATAAPGKPVVQAWHFSSNPYFGGRLVALPDGTALAFRTQWNGARWVIRWDKVGADGKTQATVVVPSSTTQFARDALLLANGDLLVVGGAHRNVFIAQGATLWRVSQSGKVVWDESPQLNTLGQSWFDAVLPGPKADEVTALGWAYVTAATQHDPWLRVVQTGGKAFCNGTE